jgi:putative solute:sodium symporter small subunit
MRDHLKIIWGGFAVWALVVFGPVTLTALAPGFMTSVEVWGFPLHYLTVSLGAPLGALVLSAVYAYTRDRLDEKYGIDHDAPTEPDTADATPAADGGTTE